MIDQKIAILGGTGKFGVHLGKKLEADNEIYISGSTVEKAEKVAKENDWKAGESTEIVKHADIVLVSVPISVTVDTIHEVGENVPSDALFCDITSVKKKPVEAMSQYSDEVLGMHPMYAPSNSISGQKVVLTPEKGKRWTEFEEFWKENGANVHITDPESHDKAMSVVQGLMHFSELVVAETLRKSAVENEDIETYSSPVYQLITDLTARMLNQKSRLYHSIQDENPENEEIRENFIESAEEIRSLIGTDDFEDKFEELKQQFDLDISQERTDEVIEFMSREFG